MSAPVFMRELYWLLGSFGVAVLINAAAIIGYGTRWTELFTQVGWTAIVAGALYGFFMLARLAARLGGWAVRRVRTSTANRGF